MTIEDTRLRNSRKQESVVRQKRQKSAQNLEQSTELVAYDKYSGKWYAVNAADGTLIIDKAYDTKGAVLRVVGKTALGKNAAKNQIEPVKEERPSKPIGYKKGQVFNFPLPKKKQLRYPIKYLYSVIEGGTRNYYIGGFQDKPVQLPAFPFVPNQFYLQNTGNSFVLGVSNNTQVAYYEGFNLVYSANIPRATYLGFGEWVRIALGAIDNSSASGSGFVCRFGGGVEKSADQVIITDRRNVYYFSNNTNTLPGFKRSTTQVGAICSPGVGSPGSIGDLVDTNQSTENFYEFATSASFVTSVVNFDSYYKTSGIGMGSNTTADYVFDRSFKRFFRLSLNSADNNFFGFFVDSSNGINGNIRVPGGFNSTTNNYFVGGSISRALFIDQLSIGASESFSFKTSENNNTPAEPGYRDDYYVNTDLYKELTDPEIFHECFADTFSSIRVSESIQDAIADGSRVAVYQVKTYDKQFQLIDDTYFNAWLPHVQSGFTIHSTSYYPQ